MVAMTANPIRITIEVGPVMDRLLIGVGYEEHVWQTRRALP